MKVKLGDVIEQIRGVSYKPSDLRSILNDESVILLRANNIQNGEVVLNDVVYVLKIKVNESQYLRKGDILVCTSSGSKELVGKAAFIKTNFPMVFGAFCKVVRPKTECHEYIGSFFQSSYYRNHISIVSSGANINNLRNEHLAELTIPFPPLDEQRRIAAVLDKVSDLIAKRRQQLEKLDELVKAHFVEMFGEYDLFHVQDDWVAISQIGSVVGGATPKTDVDEYWGGDYGWLTPADLEVDSGVVYDSQRKLTKAGIESCSLQELPIGTVIFSSRAPIGKVAITGCPFYCNQGFKNIVCGSKVVPWYLYYLLLLNTDYLNSLGRGATFKEVSKAIVEQVKIPLPAYDNQVRFGDFVEGTRNAKTIIARSLEKLETLKRALMQRYFG